MECLYDARLFAYLVFMKYNFMISISVISSYRISSIWVEDEKVAIQLANTLLEFARGRRIYKKRQNPEVHVYSKKLNKKIYVKPVF